MIVTSSAIDRPLIPDRAVSEPANLRLLTGTGTGGSAWSGKTPGFSTSMRFDRSIFWSSSTFTRTFVEAALTTFSTLRSPGVIVTFGNDSTSVSPSRTTRLNGDGPSTSSSPPSSTGCTAIASAASGSTLVTAIGLPRARSAAGRAAVVGAPAGSVFGIRTM